jgi:outer membrane receptor protein involved in Fe transport
LTYESSVLPDQSIDFGFREPSYILGDALLSYRLKGFGKPVNLSLVVNNFANVHYYSGRVGYGAPRTWKLSADVNF